MKRVVFKARLGDGPIQVVGDYEFSSEEWEEEMDIYGDIENWLGGPGSDWAYEAVHSDCLSYWSEIEEINAS